MLFMPETFKTMDTGREHFATDLIRELCVQLPVVLILRSVVTCILNSKNTTVVSVDLVPLKETHAHRPFVVNGPFSLQLV
jgi:hypothetical protein